MSDEVIITQHPVREIFRWDVNGNLVYVHPTIVQRLREDARLDLQNELSLLISMQRMCTDLDARIIKLEQECAQLRLSLIAATKKPATVPGMPARVLSE